jgi:CDP-glucose 4,6-dehydratase
MSIDNKPDTSFWKNKRVLITGNTGFKGSWFSIIMNYLGADIMGYSLNPPTKPSMFEVCGLKSIINTQIADINNYELLSKNIQNFNPEIIFHLAAQPLVKYSYENPLLTYETNVLGTAKLLEAAKQCKSLKSIVVITTDKCYENKEWIYGYRENDTLGGYDPYASSKACAELVTDAYRKSFLNQLNINIATARAGNVIGGGDWADNRLVPDCIRAIISSTNIPIRYPYAVRPWQHVIEPLSGYILLAEKLFNNNIFAEAWNVGPENESIKTVEWIVKNLIEKWKTPINIEYDTNLIHHETTLLSLDSTKAKLKLNWKPKWSVEKALEEIINWHKALLNNKNMMDISLSQIEEYFNN